MGAEDDRSAERVGRRWPAALGPVVGLVLLAAGILGGEFAASRCHGGEAPPSPTTVVPGREGWHDTDPSISEDGKTIVWFHIAETDARICLATAPFESAPATLKVGTPLGSYSPVVSGDGRLVFWAGRGEDDAPQLQRASIKDGKLLKPAPVTGVKAGWLGLCVSKDGSRVAFLEDGPPAPQVSPSWRAVRTALLKDGPPELSQYLTPRELRKHVDRLFMSSAGDTLAFVSEGRIMEAHLREGVSWDIKPIDVPGFKKPDLMGITPDGKTLLFANEFDSKAKDGGLQVSTYVMRNVGGSWQKPEKVAEEPWPAAITSDGKTVVVTCFDRGPDGKAITRTSLQVVRFENGTWSKPSVLVERKGFADVYELALSPGGCLVWSWFAGSSETEKTSLFYRKDLEPGTEAVDLSARLEAAIKKEAAGNPAKPEAKP
jgi:hypothetical protein